MRPQLGAQPLLFSPSRRPPPLPLPSFLLWQQMKQLLSQLQFSGSQVTFPLSRLTASAAQRWTPWAHSGLCFACCPCTQVETGSQGAGWGGRGSWMRPPRPLPLWVYTLERASFAFLFCSGFGIVPSSFSIFVSCPLPTGLAAAAPSCPQNVNISGGSFTLSHGWAPGSVLVYSCPLGRYPVPTSRLCLSSGRWQTPRSNPMTKAVCKRELTQDALHTGISTEDLLHTGLSLPGSRGREGKAFSIGLCKIAGIATPLAGYWRQALKKI